MKDLVRMLSDLDKENCRIIEDEGPLKKKAVADSEEKHKLEQENSVLQTSIVGEALFREKLTDLKQSIYGSLNNGSRLKDVKILDLKERNRMSEVENYRIKDRLAAYNSAITSPENHTSLRAELNQIDDDRKKGLPTFNNGSRFEEKGQSHGEFEEVKEEDQYDIVKKQIPLPTVVAVLRGESVRASRKVLGEDTKAAAGCKEMRFTMLRA
ncbi:hypothetical protein Nepgr_022705 [Nepenthes gracilis]|uniref:Uncharacterized protein n=1 Tax=Nepenthes gracilis TaxID=150966 RepID=A0AAD3XX92_NEPGR|nr:hypothetical protein Nepgr_022705 [Nepenthes gracilis]